MPRPILGALQLEGEVFSLDIPSYRTAGWPDFFGSPKISEEPLLVNMTGVLTNQWANKHPDTRMILFVSSC